MKDLYAFTDVHGCYPLYKAITDWCFKQDPECTVIFLGDAADRGEDGYKIIKELLSNPQIIYLYGNHEDLFVKAADAIIGRYAKNDELYSYLHSCDKKKAKSIVEEMYYKSEEVQLHLYNGGKSTLIDWLLDGANEEIIDNLRGLPRTFSYENLDFCHAGGAIKCFKEISAAEYEGKSLDKECERILIWDRDLLDYGWENGRILIHGHTPTIYLPAGIYGRDKSEKNAHPCIWEEKLGAKDQRGGKRIDMDTGMVFTKRGFVLNCLTMKMQGFELKENKIELIEYKA